MTNPTMFSFAGLQIEVLPFSADTVGYEAAADFAAKELLGSMRSREFVGPGDERIQFAGRLFPETIASMAGGGGGGINELDLLDTIRRAAMAHILLRGDGRNLGWYFLEGVTQSHSRLRGDGVPRQLEYSFSLVRAPVPRAADYISALLRLFA